MKKTPLFISMGIGITLALSGCGSSSSPTQSAASANSPDTSNNKGACLVLRDVYTKNGQVLSDWSNQLATDADLEVAIKKLGDEFTNFYPPYTSGDFGLMVQTLGMDFKRTRVAATKVDTAALTPVIKGLSGLITSFDTLCNAMGH